MSMAGEIRRAARHVYADGQAHENAEVRDELARRGFPLQLRQPSAKKRFF